MMPPLALHFAEQGRPIGYMGYYGTLWDHCRKRSEMRNQDFQNGAKLRNLMQLA
jgi:hypothetical protein